VGDRWALLVARELMLGPRRFSQIQAALPGINPKALSQRLSEMEKRAILFRRKLPPPAAVNVYELTEWGYELEEVTAAMGRWAARSPFREPGLSISAVSLLLSFRAMLDRVRAEDLKFCIGFQFGEDHYHALLEDGSCQILSGEGADEAAVFDGSPDILATTIYISHSLEVAEAQGLRILGRREAAQRFIEIFPLPVPARSGGEVAGA
jgi:DNA-binding HxlR family transcriptional regulator